MQRPLEADRVRQVPAVHAEALLAVVEAVRSQHLVQPEIGRGVGGGAAALVEPLSCVVHGLRRLSMPAGSDLLVVGAGTIGLLLMQAARRSGAAEVSVIDPDHSRRALAARMGADAVAASLDDLMGNQDPHHRRPGVLGDALRLPGDPRPDHLRTGQLQTRPERRPGLHDPDGSLPQGMTRAMAHLAAQLCRPANLVPTRPGRTPRPQTRRLQPLPPATAGRTRRPHRHPHQRDAPDQAAPTMTIKGSDIGNG